MLEEEKLKFGELLTDVFSAYKQDISEFQLNAFWASLKRFDYDAISYGFGRHYGSPDRGQFAPKPGDIIRLIEGSSGDRGMLAWVAVDQAVRSVGPYQSVVFDDPITQAVIRDMGGWIQLGNCTEKDFEFRGKEFANRYRAYAETGRKFDHPKKLIGITEMENSKNQEPTDDPLLLGNPEKAAIVMRRGSERSSLLINKPKNIADVLAIPVNEGARK